MSTQAKFASPEIAKEMAKVFGSKVAVISVQIKHAKAVGDFVRKIEEAHENTSNSSLVFG